MYTLGALLLLATLVGTVIAVVESILATIGLHDTFKNLPLIGAHLGLIISVLVVWFTKAHPAEDWGVKFDDTWVTNVANGAIIYAMIPLKDAVISMVNKGLRA